MRSVPGVVLFALSAVLAQSLLVAAVEEPPPWAYGFASASGASPCKTEKSCASTIPIDTASPCTRRFASKPHAASIACANV